MIFIFLDHVVNKSYRYSFDKMKDKVETLCRVCYKLMCSRYSKVFYCCGMRELKNVSNVCLYSRVPRRVLIVNAI